MIIFMAFGENNGGSRFKPKVILGSRNGLFWEKLNSSHTFRDIQFFSTDSESSGNFAYSMIIFMAFGENTGGSRFKPKVILGSRNGLFWEKLNSSHTFRDIQFFSTDSESSGNFAYSMIIFMAFGENTGGSRFKPKVILGSRNGLFWEKLNSSHTFRDIQFFSTDS